MILNMILKVPGPPEPLNKLKNRFFKKSQNFQKIAKKYDDDDDDDPTGTSPLLVRLFGRPAS